MKIFIQSFVLAFVVLLAAFIGMEYLVRIEQKDAARQHAESAGNGQESSDDFGLPVDAIADSLIAATATATAINSSSGSAEIPVKEANKELESLFAAIAGDDAGAVADLLKSGIKLDQEAAWCYEVGSDHQFSFYASQPTMLYNPLSLAIVAEATQSLPLLLAAASNSQCLASLNAMTCRDRTGPDQPGYDLLGMALQAGNLELLRSLLSAGLRPERQAYLIIALNAGKRARQAEFSRELLLATMRNRASLFVEMINNGQSIEQRLPLPFPTPPITELFFAIAGPEITADVISRIDDPVNKAGLQKIAAKIKRTPPEQHSSAGSVASASTQTVFLKDITSFDQALDGLILALKTAGRKCPRSFMEKGSETVDGRSYFVIQAGESNAYRFETHQWYYIEKHTGMISTLDVVADRLVETGLRCLREPAAATGKTAGGTTD